MLRAPALVDAREPLDFSPAFGQQAAAQRSITVVIVEIFPLDRHFPGTRVDLEVAILGNNRSRHHLFVTVLVFRTRDIYELVAFALCEFGQLIHLEQQQATD